MGEALYVRYQGTTPNARGHYPGVFALANGLQRRGELSEEEQRFLRAGNDWYQANFTDPSTVDPDVYDRDLHPRAAAWFKVSAEELIGRVDGYLALLAAHGVPCGRIESTDPGEIVYEDPDQVIAVPRGAGG